VNPVEKLLALQEKDCAIRDMEKEMRDIPARKEAELVRLNQHREEVTAGEQDQKRTQADIKQMDLDAASQKEQIQKLRQQQLQLKTNKEFKAMEAEIAAIQEHINGLEDRELERMEELEQSRARVAESERALAAEDAEVQADIRALDERRAGIEARLEQVKEERVQAAAEVDPDLLTRYERIFSRKDRALVPVEGNVCGGCHMQLPPALVHDARRGDGRAVCGYCGRMLYASFG